MAILANSNDFVAADNLNWQQHLKAAIRTPQQLADYLELPLELICSDQSSGNFPLFVPLPFLQQIKKRDLNDPLLLQILPTNQESVDQPGFSADPLNESEFSSIGGLIKKYENRALLVVNGTCAIHCRYCFRRHFPYSELSAELSGHSKKWQAAIDQIQNDQTIEEVILSGGDPLTLVDDQFERLVQKIDGIEHVRRLRIHTRLPVVIPQRVTQRLVEIMESSCLSVVMVLHSNHANELGNLVQSACQLLRKSSVQLLNQSVLLKGVNDNLKALTDLSKRLIEIGVLPYYLHQLDPVSGAAHFQVSVNRGIDLTNQLRSSLSGYLVPRFVQEVPGELNKTALA